MKRVFFIAGLFVALLHSCNKPGPQFLEIDTSQMEEIIIDPQNGVTLPIDSFIDKIEYVKLETDSSNLIGRVSQILFTDSLLIIADNISKSINIFNRKGNFKCRIENIGNGPAEYVEISHVAIVPDKNQIVVMDRPQKKIIYYSYSGEYEYSERFPFMLNYFEYLESGYKAFNENSMKDPVLGNLKENTLIVTNTQNEVIYGACNDYYKEDQFTYTMHNSLRKFDKEVYFSPNFSDLIYLIGDSAATAKYHINIKRNGMPPLNKNITDEKFSDYCSKFFIFNGDFIELKKLTYIRD